MAKKGPRATKVSSAEDLSVSTPATEGVLPASVKPPAGVPAGRSKKPATALSAQRMDPLWKLLDERIGGREGLLEAALASNNPKAKELVELILDKAHRNWGTKALARKAGFGTPEVVDMFRDKKWLEATLELHDQLPEIIRGAADDAKPSMIPCPDCKGTKKDETGNDCWVCRGTGEIRKAGDKEKLSFVGEAVGLVGKKGPVVQSNTQIINMPQQQGQSFESLMRRATVTQQKQLSGVVDVEASEESKKEIIEG